MLLIFDNKAKVDFIVLIMAMCTSAVLLLIYINHTIIGTESTALGIVQEIVVLPCIISQPVLLFLAARSLIRSGNYRSPALVSLLISGITLVAVGISFLTA